MQENNLLIDSQSSFRLKGPCHTALTNMTEDLAFKHKVPHEHASHLLSANEEKVAGFFLCHPEQMIIKCELLFSLTSVKLLM